MCLCDPGGDRAYSRFGDQLDRHASARVDLLQVVDQLREVFDRVDVVMWRRRDQRNAGHRMANRSDLSRDLVTGQLTAFAGLRALRDFYLELFSRHQVFRRDAKARRRHLFDVAVSPIPLTPSMIPSTILAPFPPLPL